VKSPIIGGLNEKSLHRELKYLYLDENSKAEEIVSGYVVDVVRSDGLVEIQTGSFSSIKRKLAALLQQHRVRLVHPIAVETMINVYSTDGSLLSGRMSPKRGSIYSAAAELLYIPELLGNPNLTIEILFIRQEEIRLNDGNGSWRRKGISIEDRRLVEVTGTAIFSELSDCLHLLPEGLPSPFGNRDIADRLKGMNKKAKTRLAGQITWLLRKLDLLEVSGKDGNRFLFDRR